MFTFIRSAYIQDMVKVRFRSCSWESELDSEIDLTCSPLKPNIQIFLFLTQFLSAILEKFNTRYNLKSEDVI